VSTIAERSLPALTVVAALAVAGCMSSGALNSARADRQMVIELPAVSGWYEGQVVHYVTTDVSDAALAAELGVNSVPRLADALGPPGRGNSGRGAVERIYRIANFEQGSVLPSAPVPTGPDNRDRAYSPVWNFVMVTWRAGATPRTLKSEEDILLAQEQGNVQLQATRIVVNCPVIFTPQGGALRGARFLPKRVQP
jgi:hypothetical protein